MPTGDKWEVVHDVDWERVRRMRISGGWLYQVELDANTQLPDGSTASVLVGWHAPIFVPEVSR